MRKQIFAAAMLFVSAIACSKQETKNVEVAETAAPATTTNAEGVAVPYGTPDDPVAQERERFDEGWRSLGGFNAVTGQPQAVQVAQVQVQFAPNGKETFEGIAPAAINTAPVVVPIKGDVSGPSVLKTQVYLDRAGFSVGAIDGRWDRNSAIALWWFQRSRGVNATEPGALDEATFRALAGSGGGPAEAVTQHTLTADDVKGPFVDIPEEVYDQEKLDCLCYESLGEKLAERFHTTPEFLEKLNPEVKLADLKEGDSLLVPNVRAELTQAQKDIAKVVISIKGNTFNAFDAAGNLVFHAPTTLGNEYDPSPTETVAVKSVTFDPWFHYQPKLFHEVPDHKPEANLHPGPNSPVGVVWIALTKPHFGIHGTTSPHTIGYASSHGCVRLTNWDAREMGHRLAEGVKVEFTDTRSEAGAAVKAGA